MEFKILSVVSREVQGDQMAVNKRGEIDFTSRKVVVTILSIIVGLVFLGLVLLLMKIKGGASP